MRTGQQRTSFSTRTGRRSPTASRCLRRSSARSGRGFATRSP